MAVCIRCGSFCTDGSTLCPDCLAWYREKNSAGKSSSAAQSTRDAFEEDLKKAAEAAERAGSDRIAEDAETGADPDGGQKTDGMKTGRESTHSGKRSALPIVLAVSLALLGVFAVAALVLFGNADGKTDGGAGGREPENAVRDDVPQDTAETGSTQEMLTEAPQTPEESTDVPEAPQGPEESPDVPEELPEEVPEEPDDELCQPFYGIWCAAYLSETDAEDFVRGMREQHLNGEVIVTSDWEGLNPERYYAVTAGRYASESEAEAALAGVQACCPGAYIKYTGDLREN